MLLRTIFSVIAVSAVYCDALPTMEVYNSSARIETLPGNVFSEFTFNYWQPIQENMELGRFDRGSSTDVALSGLTVTSVTSSDSYKEINMDFDYKPGFTLGFGVKFDHDNWDARIQYTWFHNTQSHHESAPNFTLFDTSTQNITPTWGISSVNEFYQSVSEKWKLSMDLIDLDLGRWFYVGRKLTFHPSIGLRTAFIQQHVRVAYTYGFSEYPVDLPGLLGEGFLVDDKVVTGRTNSWAIGPRAALETNWNLGKGIRLFGKGEVDLLYTRYTTLKNEIDTTGNVVGAINFVPFLFSLSDDKEGKQRNVGCLRTHLDLELGLGWGTHVNSDTMYIDVAAGYDFQVFFDQNMLRRNINDRNNSIPNGNLYIQGLIATVRLDY